ncbi:MAG: hypothetical protein R3F14_43500 [Polyangiaceae bacterium]
MALPLSRAELLADLSSENPSDFARGLGGMFARTDHGSLAWEHETQMETARRVVAFARSLGVTVVERASLMDLHELTSHHHVVTLVAHAPSPGVEPADILDPRGFIGAVRAGDDEDHGRVRRHLASCGVALDPESPPSREVLAHALNRALWTRDLLAERTADQVDRTRIEDAFPSLVRPAPVLELASGLCHLSEVRRAISPRFDGVLDLTACTSVVLAAALKRTRNDFLAIGTVRPTIPRHGFMLYQLRLEQIASAPLPIRFSHAVRLLAESLKMAASK